MKRAIALAGAFALVSCETVPPEGLSFARPRGQAPVPGTIIQTVPSGATLAHPDGECLTPCRVDYGRVVTVTVGKTGYKALDVTIPLGAKDTVLELTPVGRSTPVETETLPLP